MATPQRWSIGLALLIAAVFADPASAQLDKCQAGLTKNSQKLEAQLAKGLDKCLATIRKNLVKGKPAAKSAVSCEKALDKLLGLGSVLPEKTKIGKFLAQVAKLESREKCLPQDLDALGHLVSGVNAPGTNDTDFVGSWMSVVKQHVAWTQHLLDNGDARALIDYVLAAGPEEDDPNECDPSKGRGCGTDCTGAPAAGYVYRPNLCALQPSVWPICRLAACHLKATGAVIQPVGAPVSLVNRKLALQICTPPDSDLPVTSPDYLFLASAPTSTFQPPPSIPFAPAVTWCIDQVRAQGWCDCAGNAIAFEPDTCIDHLADLGGTCAADPNEVEVESDCICTVPVGPPNRPCGTAGCTECRSAKSGGRCHPGALRSEPITTYSGASGANDCLLLATLQFRFLSPGTCVDASGNPLGPCNAVGPPTAICTALGGVSCAASVGPDGVACTADDLPAVLETRTVPLTTGTPITTIENFNLNDGVCLQGNNGMNCMTNADCDTIAGGPGDGECQAATFGCGTGPNPEDCSHAPGVGLGVSCTALRSGNLTNFALSGALPMSDQVPQLKDYNITFELDCN